MLEDRAFELKLVNAHHVMILPGRKSDVLDAEWLAELLEHGLLRGSFVPPPAIRALRDLTRYRVDLLAARTAEKQRVEKLLEESRPGARCPDCSGSVSPGRSPNPPCASRRNGLSTVPAGGSGLVSSTARVWGSCCRGRCSG